MQQDRGGYEKASGERRGLEVSRQDSAERHSTAAYPRLARRPGIHLRALRDLTATEEPTTPLAA